MILMPSPCTVGYCMPTALYSICYCRPTCDGPTHARFGAVWIFKSSLRHRELSRHSGTQEVKYRQVNFNDIFSSLWYLFTLGCGCLSCTDYNRSWMYTPHSDHGTINQCRFNAGPLSTTVVRYGTTLSQHWLIAMCLLYILRLIQC